MSDSLTSRSDASTGYVVEVIAAGPQGPPGPILLLEHGAEIPPGTPDGTIIFEKDL